ncbi:hypothetical protein BASA81_015075 [Batrachochytrium salamandrivorans]|nr:hypothetical protein BASA81_015075 [Batrachochytrium salamandrivorans]
MIQLALFLACALLVNAQSALNGYHFQTNVTDLLGIATDMNEFYALLDVEDYTAAENLYKNGKNSKLASGGLRSMQSLADKAAGEELFELFKAYHGFAAYGDNAMLAILRGQGNYAGKERAYRDEAASKIVGYTVVLQAVVHELALGAKACRSGATPAQIIAYVDAAWAYYGSTSFAGVVSRCSTTSSCTANGGSTITNELLVFFFSAQAAATTQDCDAYDALYPKIKANMYILPLQSTMRYAKSAAANPTDSKLRGEGWGFAYSVLPLVNKCSPSAATILRNNFDPAVATTQAMGSNTVAEVTAAIAAAIPCLGLSCNDFLAGTCVDAPEMYRPKTDVSLRTLVSSDTAELGALLDEENYVAAEALFKNGKNVKNADGSLVSLASIEREYTSGEYFELYKAYYGSATYASDMALAAIRGTGSFAGKEGALRDETASKVTSSIITAATMHQFYQGAATCRTGATGAEIVRFVDGAWAYYGSGSYASTISRCSTTSSCLSNGRSTLANHIVVLFNALQSAAMAQDCDSYDAIFAKLKAKLFVMPIQNTLRYAKSASTNPTSSKLRGEGWGSPTASCPCSTCTFGGVSSTFSCLGLSCTEFGNGTCVDAPVLYNSKTDMSRRMLLASDTAELGALLDEENYVAAEALFTNGKNSKNADGTLVSMAKIEEQYNSGEHFELFKAYYGSATYGTDVVMAALRGTGYFAGKDGPFRDEAVSKVASTTIVMSAVMHELAQGAAACRAGASGANIASFVDGAWAYYGPGSYGGTISRCSTTSSCLPNGRSTLANSLIVLYNSIQAAALVQDCDEYDQLYTKLKAKMYVMPIQSTMRYAKSAAANPTSPKLRGEGWGFSYGILPLLNKCSPSAATILRNNFDPTVATTQAMGANTVAQVNAAIASTFTCLGLSCEDFLDGTCTDAPTTVGESNNTNSNGLTGGQIAGIVVGVVIFYVLSLLAVAYCARKRTQAAKAPNKGLDENTSHASLSKV